MLGVASGIGMSAPGLRNFLEGGTPRVSTLRKINVWAVREAATRGESFADEVTMKAALSVLVAGVPERGRKEAAQTLIDALRKAYERHGVQTPVWLARMSLPPS